MKRNSIAPPSAAAPPNAALRAVAAAALYPVQRTLLVPVELIENAADYLVGLHVALSREEAARIELARQAERAMRAEQNVSLVSADGPCRKKGGGVRSMVPIAMVMPLRDPRRCPTAAG